MGGTAHLQFNKNTIILFALPQKFKGFRNYPQKNFVKNFVSFEIMLYLQHYSPIIVAIRIMAKKKKYTIEYIIKSSPLVLYNCLISATGLQQWFADTVDNEGDTFFFTWNGETETAQMLSDEDDDYIRFRWEYQDNDEYFEFRIDKTEITNDTILFVTDFADDKEMDSQKRLWDAQIHNLIKRIGAS